MERLITNIQLFTTEEVCLKLKISRSTLAKLRKEEKIKAVYLGESVRFTEAEIARFINESTEPQTD